MPAWETALKRYARMVLAELGKDLWDLSVMLCSDETMQALNSRYRGKAGTTDVLTFSLDEGEAFPVQGGIRRQAGDIVISLDSLAANARRFGISEDEELRRLLIHGILHLDGMDHRTNGKTEPMLQLQEQILTKLSGESIIGRNP